MNVEPTIARYRMERRPRWLYFAIGYRDNSRVQYSFGYWIVHSKLSKEDVS